MDIRADSILDHLDPSLLTTLHSTAPRLTYAAGSEILAADRAPDGALLVSVGSVWAEERLDRDPVRISAGGIVFEWAIMTPDVAHGAVAAATDCEVLLLQRSIVRQALLDSPTGMWKTTRRLCEAIRNELAWSIGVHVESTPLRVLRFLRELTLMDIRSTSIAAIAERTEALPDDLRRVVIMLEKKSLLTVEGDTIRTDRSSRYLERAMEHAGDWT